MKQLLACVMLGFFACTVLAAEKSRVLILLADGFNREEHYLSAMPLKALGYQVDIAGIEKGTVFCSTKREPDKQNRDVTANLSLKDVKVGEYIGMIIPGGYSPGNLEKHPEALDICRAFMQENKLIAGVCHGPRLLMRAGLLKGRRITCLYSVADELADDWKAGNYGQYFDQPVVVDDNLITSRYPGDMKAFMEAFVTKAAERGGIEPYETTPTVLLVTTAARTGHEKWVLRTAPGILGVKIELIDSVEALTGYQEKESYNARQFDVILAVEGADEIVESDAFKALVKDSGLKPQSIPAADPYDRLLVPIVQLAHKSVAGKVPGELAAEKDSEALMPLVSLLGAVAKAKRPVVIALRKGFDDDVVRAAMGFSPKSLVLLVGHEKGSMAGLNGLQVEVTDTYARAEAPGNAVIIAPGGIYPEKAAARQAEQPAWVEEQDRLDQARVAWLMGQRKGGATLVTVGFDSLRVARNPVFKGKKFACSDQAVWSFPKKTAGAYSGDPVVETDERLVSVESAAVLQQALAAGKK